MGASKGIKRIKNVSQGTLRGYSFQLFPDTLQTILINKNIGHNRFLYNKLLDIKQYHYKTYKKGLNKSELSKMLPSLKETYPFLHEACSQSLQQTNINLDRAYQNFFAKKSKFPKKKKRVGKESFNLPQGVDVDFKTGHIYLPKFYNGIKFDNHRSFFGKIKSATIYRSAAGEYFISILVDDQATIISPKTSKSVGLDMGLTHFITTSDGEKIEAPKFLRKKEKSLKRSQRNHSKKQKGSKNKLKSGIRLAKIREKIVNQRKDFLHKLSNRLTNEYDKIYIENINIRGLIKNYKVSKSFSDLGWGMFVIMIIYKAKWKKKEVIKIGRYMKSTGVCDCGYQTKLELNVRSWACPECGLTHDRDIQAAKIIKLLGEELAEVTSVEMEPPLDSLTESGHVLSRKQKLTRDREDRISVLC